MKYLRALGVKRKECHSERGMGLGMMGSEESLIFKENCLNQRDSSVASSLRMILLETLNSYKYNFIECNNIKTVKVLYNGNYVRNKF